MGHGTYSEITNEKEFFECAKKSDNFVCHFYRPSTARCDIVDKHLRTIAQNHLECRFVRINAEKCPFLVEKFLVVVLPTITICMKGKVLDHIVGFDDIGGQPRIEFILRDEGYPGSAYQLVFMAERRVLVGTYARPDSEPAQVYFVKQDEQ